MASSCTLKQRFRIAYQTSAIENNLHFAHHTSVALYILFSVVLLLTIFFLHCSLSNPHIISPQHDKHLLLHHLHQVASRRVSAHAMQLLTVLRGLAQLPAREPIQGLRARLLFLDRALPMATTTMTGKTMLQSLVVRLTLPKCQRQHSTLYTTPRLDRFPSPPPHL